MSCYFWGLFVVCWVCGRNVIALTYVWCVVSCCVGGVTVPPSCWRECVVNVGRFASCNDPAFRTAPSSSVVFFIGGTTCCARLFEEQRKLKIVFGVIWALRNICTSSNLSHAT